MEYIGNAFSLNMVTPSGVATWEPCARRDVPKDAKSVIGHADLAAVLKLPANRETVTLVPGDVLYVAQYKGDRLAEGATLLPPGATVEWLKVTVYGPSDIEMEKTLIYDAFSCGDIQAVSEEERFMAREKEYGPDGDLSYLFDARPLRVICADCGIKYRFKKGGVLVPLGGGK